MILLLFGLALVLGILVGLGARSLTRNVDLGAQSHRSGASLSAEAADLGYKSENDFASDRDRAEGSLMHVLTSGAGQQDVWENAETGNRGLFWASAETKRPDGAVCRDVERRTLINNAFRNASGVACRTAQGAWDGSVKWRGQ